MQMPVRVGGSRLTTFPSRTPLAALGTHLKFVIMNLKVKPVGPVCGFFQQHSAAWVQTCRKEIIWFLKTRAQVFWFLV